jgi:hypothetical protein
MGAYVTWVDAIALDKIGKSTVSLPIQTAHKDVAFRLQILWCLHAIGRHSVGAVL